MSTTRSGNTPSRFDAFFAEHRTGKKFVSPRKQPTAFAGTPSGNWSPHPFSLSYRYTTCQLFALAKGYHPFRTRIFRQSTSDTHYNAFGATHAYLTFQSVAIACRWSHQTCIRRSFRILHPLVRTTTTQMITLRAHSIWTQTYIQTRATWTRMTRSCWRHHSPKRAVHASIVALSQPVPSPLPRSHFMRGP